MYAIFIKSSGFKDLKYCKSQQSSVDKLSSPVFTCLLVSMTGKDKCKDKDTWCLPWCLPGVSRVPGVSKILPGVSLVSPWCLPHILIVWIFDVRTITWSSLYLESYQHYCENLIKWREHSNTVHIHEHHPTLSNKKRLVLEGSSQREFNKKSPLVESSMTPVVHTPSIFL